jgi:hypothetical protein
MGMKPGPNGSLTPQKGYLTQQIHKLPEMFYEEMPTFDIIEYDPLLGKIDKS